jgi:hypothetical protein
MSPGAESPDVLFVSLKAGGVGINLTAASSVYMLDPWWNPAIEDQAMDRVHRLGQTRDVSVVRFCARDTIEERLFELQIRKRELAAAAFKKMSAKSAARCAAPTSSACWIDERRGVFDARDVRTRVCYMFTKIFVIATRCITCMVTVRRDVRSVG